MSKTLSENKAQKQSEKPEHKASKNIEQRVSEILNRGFEEGEQHPDSEQPFKENNTS